MDQFDMTQNLSQVFNQMNQPQVERHMQSELLDDVLDTDKKTVEFFIKMLNLKVFPLPPSQVPIIQSEQIQMYRAVAKIIVEEPNNFQLAAKSIAKAKNEAQIMDLLKVHHWIDYSDELAREGRFLAAWIQTEIDQMKRKFQKLEGEPEFVRRYSQLPRIEKEVAKRKAREEKQTLKERTQKKGRRVSARTKPRSRWLKAFNIATAFGKTKERAEASSREVSTPEMMGEMTGNMNTQQLSDVDNYGNSQRPGLGFSSNVGSRASRNAFGISHMQDSNISTSYLGRVSRYDGSPLARSPMDAGWPLPAPSAGTASPDIGPDWRWGANGVRIPVSRPSTPRFRGPSFQETRGLENPRVSRPPSHLLPAFQPRSSRQVLTPHDYLRNYHYQQAAAAAQPQLHGQEQDADDILRQRRLSPGSQPSELEVPDRPHHHSNTSSQRPPFWLEGIIGKREGSHDSENDDKVVANNDDVAEEDPNPATVSWDATMNEHLSLAEGVPLPAADQTFIDESIEHASQLSDTQVDEEAVQKPMSDAGTDNESIHSHADPVQEESMSGEGIDNESIRSHQDPAQESVSQAGADNDSIRSHLIAAEVEGHDAGNAKDDGADEWEEMPEEEVDPEVAAHRSQTAQLLEGEVVESVSDTNGTPPAQQQVQRAVRRRRHAERTSQSSRPGSRLNRKPSKRTSRKRPSVRGLGLGRRGSGRGRATPQRGERSAALQSNPFILRDNRNLTPIAPSPASGGQATTRPQYGFRTVTEPALEVTRGFNLASNTRIPSPANFASSRPSSPAVRKNPLVPAPLNVGNRALNSSNTVGNLAGRAAIDPGEALRSHPPFRTTQTAQGSIPSPSADSASRLARYQGIALPATSQAAGGEGASRIPRASPWRQNLPTYDDYEDIPTPTPSEYARDRDWLNRQEAGWDAHQQRMRAALTPRGASPAGASPAGGAITRAMTPTTMPTQNEGTQYGQDLGSSRRQLVVSGFTDADGGNTSNDTFLHSRNRMLSRANLRAEAEEQDKMPSNIPRPAPRR